jgi:1-deoxyxylulose-5-phosphate synthase
MNSKSVRVGGAGRSAAVRAGPLGSRRQFLSGLAVGVASVGCADGKGSGATGEPFPPFTPGTSTEAAPAAEPSAPMGRTASDQVLLGSTGITISRLVMGSGSHGYAGASDQTRLGLSAFSSMLVNSFDQGITFWETADQYGAHPHLNQALQQVGRQKVVVLTKTHATTAAQMEADLNRYLAELGTDHIDIVLLHALESSNWVAERQGAMEYLSRAKERGVIRAHGVSCHSLAALRLAARTPWVEVDFARINPAGLHMDADPATVISVLREMKAAGKGVVGMKILGQGEIRDLDMAIGHAVRLDCIDAFTIGFTSRAQLEEIQTKIAAV